MSKFTKRILAFVITAVMIFSIVPAGVINASAATESKTLSYDNSLIKQIGAQPKGSGYCSVFSLAYCRTIIDGKKANPYNYWSGGAIWSKGGYTSKFYKNKLDAYKVIYDCISRGYPAIMRCGGSGISSQHYVAVVGYKNVSNVNNLNINNFVFINSGNFQ